MNKADALVGNIKYEFKSWTPGAQNPWNSFFSGTGNSYTQFIRYLQNTSNLNELRYVFNEAKVSELQVKNAFKELFSIPEKKLDVFNTIWENEALRGSLFGNIPSNQLDALYSSRLVQFSNWVNELDPKIYNFIEAQ